MSKDDRPIAVVCVASLYIMVGAAGVALRFPRKLAFHQDDLWILLTEALALIAGVFLLRGRNWARWLAIAWMAFHVGISWPVIGAMVVHALMLAAIAWALFLPSSQRYFAGGQSGG
jgi:hypothetical protein